MYPLIPHSSTTLFSSNHSTIGGTRVKEIEWAYIKILRVRGAMDRYPRLSTDPLMVTFDRDTWVTQNAAGGI